MNIDSLDAISLSQRVNNQEITAIEVTGQFLDYVEQQNPRLNCFTTILKNQAFEQAKILDIRIAKGEDTGVLTGVPFAVKNLFDIEGIITLAGSKINKENSPATEDATAIKKLKAAGAILVGALNMDEYAYGFVTENSHYGATPNPHDLSRISGGSSGGSAAAVAASLVPFS